MYILGVDAQVLGKYAVPDDGVTIPDDIFVNWMGLRTSADLFGADKAFGGRRFTELPVGAGGDGVYGGYFEYAALITTVEQAFERERFTAVELGAGWGPWISAAGRICGDLGFREIVLVGVEADVKKCSAMREHFERNDLIGKVTLSVIQAAVWKEDGFLKFPVIELDDWGAAASVLASKTDYRGFVPNAYVDVPAKSLGSICEGLDRIDYMHWDIQGAEADLALANAELLNGRVASLFVGTHSRLVEGQLLDFLHANQWEVVAHNACHYVYDRNAASLLHMLHTDGEIVARNPRLWRGPGI